MKTTQRLAGWLLAVVLLVGNLSAVAKAAEAPVLQRIVQSGTLRVAMSGDQAPLNVKDRSGQMMGLEVDLAMLLAAAFNAELKIVQKPFPSLLPALKAGEVDLIMSGMSITPERTLEISFVGPYFLSGKSILTKSRLLAGAQGPSDIDDEGIKLAALASSTSESFVKKNIPNAHLVTTNDYDTALQMVLKDEVDAMVADMPICLLSVLQYPQAGLATLSQPLNVEPIGIAMSADDPQLKNLLDNYLSAIEGTGILSVLQKKWFEDGSWVAALP